MKINKVNIRKGTVTIDDVKYDIERYTFNCYLKFFYYEEFYRDHAAQLISAGFTGELKDEFTDPVRLLNFVRGCPELWEIADTDYCLMEYTDYGYFGDLWDLGKGMLYNDEYICLADPEFHKNMIHQFYLTDGQYLELDVAKEDLKWMDKLERKYRRY